MLLFSKYVWGSFSAFLGGKATLGIVARYCCLAVGALLGNRFFYMLSILRLSEACGYPLVGCVLVRSVNKATTLCSLKLRI